MGRGCRKKLRGAFRFRLERQGAEPFDEWIADLVDEFPDEEWLGEWGGERPDDAEPQPWHGLYLRAWDALRFDRQYGAMGGETFISYVALRAYAEAESIGDWPTFHRFMIAIDDEWLQHVTRLAAKDKS